MSRMYQCPKYEGCEAPLCPLDEAWNVRRMIQSDPLCHYLCEASKEGAIQRFKGRHDESTFICAYNLCEEMRSYSKALIRGLDRASKTPSVIPMMQLNLDLE